MLIKRKIFTSLFQKHFKASICGHLIAGIAVSNPAEDMDVRLLCLLCVV